MDTRSGRLRRVVYGAAFTSQCAKYSRLLYCGGGGSHRVDGAFHQNRLRRAIVPPGDSRADVVEPEPGYTLSGPRLSSVSVWYQDVYDRWYRSRLLFRYERSTEEAMHEVVPLFEEFTRIPGPPPYSWDTIQVPRPPNYVGLAEGGRCIPWNPLEVGHEWHTLDSFEKAKSVVLPGNDTTRHEALTVADMGFWLETAWPQFVIQVGGRPPLVLTPQSTGFANPSPEQITVLATELYPRAWTDRLPGPLPPKLPDLDWRRFGLALGPRAKEQLWELYQAIWIAIQDRIATHHPNT